MTIRNLDDTGGRAAPASGILRRALARAMVAREAPARRSVNTFLLGLDDATLASFGRDRQSLEHAGRGPFAL